MNETTNIERVVMRRVRLIRILGLIISTGVFAALAFMAALWGIGKEVWVARIFENMPPNLADVPRFYMNAFLHTRFIVQVLTVLTTASMLFLIREIIRFLSDFFSARRA